MILQQAINKLAMHLYEKPRLIFFVPIILTGIFMITLPIILGKIFISGVTDVSKYDKILSYIFHHPFKLLLLVGLIFPVFETICAQMIPIEIMKRFGFSNKIMIILSAIIFSISHFLWGFFKTILTFPAGVILAFSYLLFRKNSLMKSFGVVTLIHGLHNTILFLILFLIVFFNLSNQIYEYDLRSAVIKGDLETVQTLLNKNIDLNSKNQQMGQTALMLAAYSGHIEIVKMLLNNGADINAKDHRGYTALIYAAMRGHKDITEILIDNGADLNSRTDYGFTALSGAQMEGKIEIVSILIQKGGKE